MPQRPIPLTTTLRNFAARPLVRNILKVLTGNLGGNVINFFAMAWLNVALGESLWLFTLLYVSFATLFAQLSDFGLNTTLIKYYRDFAVAGREDEAEALLRVSLWLRLAVIGVLVGACMALAGPIARLLIQYPPAVGTFRLACLAAVSASLWAFCQAAMQARQQFGLYALLTTGNHVLRLLLVWLLVHMHWVSVTSAIVVMLAAPLLGALSSARLWPRRFWTSRIMPETLRRQCRSIFHFSKWIFLSSVITTVIMRLDVLLLRLLNPNPAQLNQYGMALTLAQGVPLITAAVSTVLLPKLAATRRRDEIRRLVRIFLKASPVLAVCVLVAIAAAHGVVPLLRGGMYRPSLPVFDLLVIGSSISIILNPISYFCLALERAHWLAWMNLAQLALTVVLSTALILVWGAVGAGVSSLLVRLFAVGWLAVLYPKLLKLAEGEESAFR